MQSLRNSIFRYLAVWLILPGYILLLSADRRNDGSFTCWLNLALATHTGMADAVPVGDLTKSAASVAEAIKNVTEWAESQSEDQHTSERNSETLYSLLIGEWKNYRQVNTSATAPTERAEYRDGKSAHRVGDTGYTADRTTEFTTSLPVTRAGQPAAEALVVSITHEPMVSGMAMGAP